MNGHSQIDKEIFFWGAVVIVFCIDWFCILWLEKRLAKKRYRKEREKYYAALAMGEEPGPIPIYVFPDGRRSMDPMDVLLHPETQKEIGIDINAEIVRNQYQRLKD